MAQRPAVREAGDLEVERGEPLRGCAGYTLESLRSAGVKPTWTLFDDSVTDEQHAAVARQQQGDVAGGVPGVCRGRAGRRRAFRRRRPIS